MSDNEDLKNERRGRGRFRGSRFSSGNGRGVSDDGRRDDYKSRRGEPVIPQHKLNIPSCVRCGQPIQDIASALADKGTGAPVHFDCVLEFLKAAEPLNPEEKITYIGQGRFAVVVFENIADPRHFKIIRIIEWEERDKKKEWREEIAGIYSQIN